MSEDKRFWSHEPRKGLTEYYDSDNWLAVKISWLISKIVVWGVAIGIAYIILCNK
jgi:hypothetical protein